MGGSVVLLDLWASPFCMRVRIALAEKAIQYECKQEDMQNKSHLLLEMNPVHKKVPVLIHNGKAVCESSTIVQYIDEQWKDKSPLMPSDPYLRAQARFWFNYVDEKVYGAVIKAWNTKGEEQEKAWKEYIDGLKVLEGQLGEKPYLMGDSFGYADIALVPLCSYYASAYEGLGGRDFGINKDTFPNLVEWAKRCMERESVSKSLGDPQKLHEFVLDLEKKKVNQLD